MTRMTGKRTKDLTYIAVFAALTVICSWIAIPAPIPVTLQTLAIFLTVGLLGGRRGTGAVLVYLLMAAAGLPVLSGFRGGIGALLSSTGGYAMGFLFTALVMWAMERLSGKREAVFFLSMLSGLAACYAFGTAWFLLFYAGESASPGPVLMTCVVPFLLPDAAKMLCAAILIKKLKRHIR